MIKGIAHLAFQVKDMEKSIEFYTQMLGFKHKFTLYDEQKNPWIIYLQLRDDQFIELFFAHEPLVVPGNQRSYQHLCLEVTEIRKLVDELASKGVHIDSPVIMGLDNNYQAWIHDPDGNPIELMEYGKDSLQLK